MAKPANAMNDCIKWTLADIERQLGQAGVSTQATPNDLRISLGEQGTWVLSQLAATGDATPQLHVEGPGLSQTFSWAPAVSLWLGRGAHDDVYMTVERALRSTGATLVLAPARVLDIHDLRTYFHTESGVVKAVDQLDASIAPGQTLGLVGESGSGKSVTSLTIMGLLPEFTARIPSGEVVFMGRDMLSMGHSDLRSLRGQDVAMIFQEPMTSLNPVYTVGDQVAESIMLHDRVSRAEAWRRTVSLFHEVGIPDSAARVYSYPHQMSGGQKQRVMIAMALSCNPRLLIADEPTTALDVTIQKQILDLLGQLRDSRGMAILFITHDLGVIAEIADHVAVMYRGKLVEYGDVVSIFGQPQHPYTKGLLACRPRLDSPYRLLPTVADFMDSWVDDDGQTHTRERVLDAARDKELREGGRAKMPEGQGEPVLSVRNLRVGFPMARTFYGHVTRWLWAVDDVSFDVYRGQTLGLVGESGCGKTTVGRAILHLVQPTSGKVIFEGQDIGFLGDTQKSLADTQVSGAVIGAAGVAAFMAMLAFMFGGSPVTDFVHSALWAGSFGPTSAATPFVAYLTGGLPWMLLAALMLELGRRLGEALAPQEDGHPASKRTGIWFGIYGGFLALSLALGLNLNDFWMSLYCHVAGLGAAGGVVIASYARIPAIEKEVRKRIQIIFQDPYASLNPRLTIEQTITEPMRVHGIGVDQADRARRAGDLLEEVGLERAYLTRWPHEFSGGQRQRICIARTLALEPSMIICDESVSALDVSVQAQVLNLLKELQERRGLTYIFISHDLSVVKFMSDVMCVMQAGKLVEQGPSDAIYQNPAEAYTRDLIDAIPRDDLENIEALQRQRSAARAERLQGALAAM